MTGLGTFTLGNVADGANRNQDVAEALGGVLPAHTPASEVARRLLGYVTGGAVEPGTRLPPERLLASSLGVGRSAVREAIAALDILGIVNVRPGSGTYLRGTASELLPETLSWGLMLGEDRTHDLIELRHTLEVMAAELAADRATPENLQRLERYVQTMSEKTADVSAFVEADQRFHVEVGDASGNVVLKDLLQNVRALLRLWADRVLRHPEDVRTALEQHAAVMEAIRIGDVEAARLAMDAHMVTAGERLRRVIRI